MTSLAVSVGRVLARVGAGLSVCAVLFFGGRYAWRWATTSPSFALSKITITGTHRAEDAELCRLAGLTRGQNLFLIDPDQVEAALEQHPWVRRAKVVRHFPAALEIAIEEHEAAALVSLGELYLLDDRGEPFKKLTAGDAIDLPLVTGVGREEYIEQPGVSAKRFQEALRTMAAFEAALPDGTKERVSEVRLERSGDVTVITTSSTEVRFGEEASPEKLSRLARVRSELKRRGLTAQVIHLDNRVRPGWVTVTLSSPDSDRSPAAN